MKLKVMTIEKSIYPEGQNPVYGDDVTKIRVDDEAGGGFLVVSQSTDAGLNEIRLTVEELCALNLHGMEMMMRYDTEMEK